MVGPRRAPRGRGSNRIRQHLFASLSRIRRGVETSVDVNQISSETRDFVAGAVAYTQVWVIDPISQLLRGDALRDEFVHPISNPCAPT